MPLALHIASSSRAKQVVYLEYGLAPENKYPGQICQLVDAVNHLLQHGVKPSELILAGDSAGVHLITGLLAHITEPCPQVAPLDLGGEQILAAVLLSPWLDMQLTSVSPTTGTMDVLTSTQLTNSAKLFGTNPSHPWCEPLVAAGGIEILRKAISGSGDTKAVVGKVLVTIGDAEVLFESCQQFFASFKQFETVVMNDRGKDAIKSIAEKGAFVFAVGLGEVHVQAGIDIATGYYNGGTMTALTAFLNTL